MKSEEYDEVEGFFRSPVFPLYVPDWLSSRTVRNMDSEQQSWYLRLLIEAWWNSAVQGTLPNDDVELRQLAGFGTVNSKRMNLLIAKGWQSHESAIFAILENPLLRDVDQLRWDEVRRQFVEFEGNPELIHNRKLTRVINEAAKFRRNKSLAGRIGATHRWSAAKGKNASGVNKRVNSKRRKLTQTNENEGLNSNRTNLPIAKRDFANGRNIAYSTLHIEEDETTATPPSLSSPSARSVGVSSDPKLNQENKDSIATGNFSSVQDVDSEQHNKKLNSRKKIVADAAEIFEHWKTVHNHPLAKFGKDRRGKVEARLKDGYTKEQLKHAVLGCKVSPKHQGENETGEVYDDLGLICRDSKHVEMFIGIYERRDQIKARTNSNAKPTKDTYTRLAEKYQREADEESAALAAADAETVPSSSEPAVRKNAALQLDAE
jgi:hypothetical protein